MNSHYEGEEMGWVEIEDDGDHLAVELSVIDLDSSERSPVGAAGEIGKHVLVRVNEEVPTDG